MFIVWVEGTYFTVELIYSDNSPALIILHVLILSFFQCIFLYIYHSTMRLHDVQALGRGKLPFSWFSFDLNSTFSFWLRRQGTDHIPFTSLAHTPTPTIPPRPSTMHTKIWNNIPMFPEALHWSKYPFRILKRVSSIILWSDIWILIDQKYMQIFVLISRERYQDSRVGDDNKVQFLEIFIFKTRKQNNL